MKQNMIQKVIKDKFNFDKISMYFPVIEEFKKVPQNPVYHREGNVYNHTKNVCDALETIEEWNTFSEKEKGVLYIATLFHDIGKLYYTKIEDGKIVSPKHAVKGAKRFREFVYKECADKFYLSFIDREQIASLIRYHGLPLWFIEKSKIEFSFIKASECLDMRFLYVLAKADLLGRECDDKDELLEKVDYFKEYAKELNCFSSKRKFKNEYTKFQYLNEKVDWYGYELFDSTQFDVFMMSGFPLSGKDTYIEQNLNQYPIISLDDIRQEFGISPKESSAKVAAIAKERAKKFLRQKKTFVWNATNIIKDTRKKLCNLFTAYGARVTIIYVEAPYEKLLERNKIRERTIPEDILEHMIHKWDLVENFEAYHVQYCITEE